MGVPVGLLPMPPSAVESSPEAVASATKAGQKFVGALGCIADLGSPTNLGRNVTPVTSRPTPPTSRLLASRTSHLLATYRWDSFIFSSMGCSFSLWDAISSLSVVSKGQKLQTKLAVVVCLDLICISSEAFTTVE